MNKSFAFILSLLLLCSCYGHAPQQEQGADSVYHRVAVDASVYAALMDSLGVGDHCLDFSSTMNPSVEAIAAAHPDAIMVSAYEGADIGRYSQLGIPVIECRDFMETSPLKRAAWMKHFGRLWGVGERGDSLFAVVEERYNALVAANPRNGVAPRVLFDTLYGNIWYQPSPESTIGRMVRDAGGVIPFAAEKQGGSIALSKEQVLATAANADIWIIRYMGDQPLTLDALAQQDPVYSQFKAFREGRVYVCNTTLTHFYEETPFRPDLLLADLIAVFHTNNAAKPTLRYFEKAK